jgi:hypothetical protein
MLLKSNIFICLFLPIKTLIANEYPAPTSQVKENLLSDLNERKIVKTISLKKVSAVAVASLGFGLLSVVPAQAGAQTSVTVSAASTTVFVGEVAKLPINVVVVGATAAQAGADVVTLTPTLVTQPTNATVPAIPGGNASALAHGAAAVGSNVFTLRMPGASNTVSTTVSAVYVPTAAADSKLTLTPATNAAAGTYNSGSLDFMANTPGTYTFAITPTLGTAGATTLVAGTFTVTVVSLGASTDSAGAVASPYAAATGVAGEFNYVTLKASGMSRTTGALGTQFVVTGGTFISASSGTLSTDKTQLVIAGVTHATNAGTESTVLVTTKTSGTVTVKSYVESTPGVYPTTATDTVTITVGAATVVGVYAGQTVWMNTSTTTPSLSSDGTTTTTAPTVAATASNTPVANIEVYQKDAQATPADIATAATKAIVYEISGAGALGSTNSQRLGSYIAVAAASTNGNDVFIYPDGRTGVGTITVKVNGVLVSTKKVNFYGAVATYTATTSVQHIANSGASTADVISVVAKDANGLIVPSVQIYASIGTSTLATITANVQTDATGTAKFAATGVATKFGAVTATFRNAATAADATVSTTAAFGVSSVLAKTLTITADKVTYTPGEKITYTLTAKDANGLGLPDGSYAADALLKNVATNPVLSGGVGTTPFLGTAAIVLKAGVATATAYAPLASGPVTATWTVAGTAAAADTTNLVTALQATTITSTITVVDANQTSLMSMIDALNAKIVALNALIAKIMKKLGVK